MPADALPWKYWEEKDFPKCKHVDFDGVNSDPDHCIDCCERTINYLLHKLSSAKVEAFEEAINIMKSHYPDDADFMDGVAKIKAIAAAIRKTVER